MPAAALSALGADSPQALTPMRTVPFTWPAETTYLDEPSEAAYGASDTAILVGPRYRRGRATACVR